MIAMMLPVESSFWGFKDGSGAADVEMAPVSLEEFPEVENPTVWASDTAKSQALVISVCCALVLLLCCLRSRLCSGLW